jgi:hypothetical protein
MVSRKPEMRFETPLRDPGFGWILVLDEVHVQFPAPGMPK